MRHAAALSIVLTMSSCGTDDGVLAPTDGNGNLAGTVAYVKTGTGVPNLVVVVMREGGIVGTASTDEAGHFSIAGLADGTYSVHLTGFELSDVDLRATAFDPVQQSATVAAEPRQMAFAAVGLVPSRVTGDVTCGGLPVEGARLRVVGGDDADLEVVTDVRGRYAATDLSEGVYAVLPAQAPCSLSPAYGVVRVAKGQAGEVDFAG